MNTRACRAGLTRAGGFAATMMLLAAPVAAENPGMPSIDLPNPYAVGVRFGQLPEGHQWGGVIAVTPDRDGKSIWAFERCGGGSCLNSDLPAVLEFDPSGKLIRSFGGGTELRSTPRAGYSLPIGPTAAFRSLARTATLSPSGSSSPVRVPYSSTRTM